MKVLAIDTSSVVASVAVADEEKLISEYIINHKKTHSQKLMPMIKETLESCEVDITDIDLFVVSIGPGSFTGLRIGVATAKGLAHSVNKPIIGVNTLDLLAYGIPYFEGIICPIIDARNNQVYTSQFKWDISGPQLLNSYQAEDIENIIENLMEQNQRVIFVGDGVAVHKDTISKKIKNLALFAPNFSAVQRASVLAELAIKKYKEGYTDSYLTLAPFYLRKSQAERMIEDKNVHV